MKKISIAKFILTLYCLVIILFPQKVFAEYIMPYPSAMPGNKMYILYEAMDKMREWWSFGSLAGFSYHLMIADKKLIEAKTLFEYKQYLLAAKAIPIYEYHLNAAEKKLTGADQERKDITKKGQLFKEAISKHKQILEFLKASTPQIYLWMPENAMAEELQIHIVIDQAITLGETLSKRIHAN